MRITMLLIIGLGLAISLSGQSRWRTTEGRVAFRSDAPLELIEADSDQLQGVIDAGERAFAFTVSLRSFEGFNSPLQREHFNENYMESKRFPKASFAGRIIEDVDLTQDGDYTVRAKGNLIIHGVEQERIIKSQLRVTNGRIAVLSEFTVLLADHDIAIPKVVYQKIAEEINVRIRAVFEPERS